MAQFGIVCGGKKWFELLHLLKMAGLKISAQPCLHLEINCSLSVAQTMPPGIHAIP